MRGEAQGALEDVDAERAAVDFDEKELRALGSVVVLEGADPSYPLRLQSLERLSRHTKKPKLPMWLLLSVVPADTEDGEGERATIWINDAYRQAFLGLFERYISTTGGEGNPYNGELVSNIGRIRRAVLEDLWQSEGAPPQTGRHWWELWLRRTDDGLDLLRAYAATRNLRLVERALRLTDRTVVWVESDWDGLQALPFTSIPLAEIRKPEFVQTIEDLDLPDQEQLADDLSNRLQLADDTAPAVCHLDSGVRRSHALISGSLSAADVHSVVPGPIGDTRNHGTPMAGLGLLGPLDDPLLTASVLRLRHRLESVKILPDSDQDAHDPLAYGLVTAEAVSMPEATASRSRVFCMPITTRSERPGEPTLWSASVDALAAGVDIAASAEGISLLGAPDPDASRLFLISAGNVDDFAADYLAACDLAAVEDPAQSWNALTVGAHTDLDDLPTDPTFSGWGVLGSRGDLSPHSRTSVTFPRRSWPLKPDICMEGGNVLTDGAEDFHERHPLLSVRTTDARDDHALGSANATSAATAQAARLAALTQATYPAYWPETIRGLLVHAADWTPPMRGRIDSAPNKTEKLSLLRRYGWGVPTEDRVLASARNAVTMVAQDEFVPFQGIDFNARHLRLHTLPWPIETLQELGAADVSLKVTLSYFVEPNAARRGWRRRYAYPSHALRFELRGPAETTDQFLARVNREAQREEDEARPSGGTSNWVVGPSQRNLGSLHQDIWEGSGAALAKVGVLAVHPVGGWWKNSRHPDRVDLPVRYSLIVSLRTEEQDVDLYTPVRVQLKLPVEEAIVVT
jgi:subtilase family protein